MLQRAYSLLHVKAVDGDKRLITGMATTPTPDRMGDVVEPLGVQFKNPLPLLLYHDSKKPVGWVKFQKPTKDGIAFEASLPSIDEPGTVRDRIEEAWVSVKNKLIGGVSIGFRSLEEAFNKETNGFRFLKTEVLELSLVAIPANADARIDTIKSLDIGRPVLSDVAPDVLRTTEPAAVGAHTRVVSLTTRTGRPMPKPISEQIAGFEATRAAKDARATEIMTVAADAGVTLDAAQKEEYDGLIGDIKEVDEHIVRLRALQSRAVEKAVQVVGTTEQHGTQSRTQVISVKDTMPADLAFGAMVLCKAHSYLEFQKGNFVTPAQVAKARYPSNELLQAYFQQKTAVAGGTTTDSNFASALLPPASVLESAFLEYLRPKTIIDRFGTTQNGVAIPSLLRVPFNVKVQSQTSGASATWVGEGKPKLVTKFNTTSTTLLFTKIAAISVITEELARFSRPGAEGLVRDELAKAVIQRMDYDFIDPDKAVSSGVNPASITNGLTGKTTAGTSAANVLSDVQTLVAPFLLANYDVSKLVLIMPNTLALVLSLMQNSLGQDSFKGMSVSGGTLAGIPVITSQYAAFGSSYGNVVICVSAENIALADDGNVSVDASREASIEMVDSSSQDATSGTGASVVSMFQTNSIALRAEREINWKKLRSDAVTFMDDVNWGSVGSPY
jgi:HK97 family phage major capsid protein/HK97 family phage prohead protease